MKYGKVAHAYLDWDSTDECWSVVITARRLSYTLDGSFLTVGEALNKVEQWARDRGLKLAIEGVPLHIVRLPQSLMHRETSP